MKEFIKYFEHKLELYCYRIYWAIYTQDVKIANEIVTGHLGELIILIFGLVCLLLSPFVPPIDFAELGLADPELRRIVLLSVTGVVIYVLISRPINNYVDKIFTQESVDRIGIVKPYSKLQNNLTKLYLTFGIFVPLSIFAVIAILIREYYWTLPCFQ